MIKDQILKNLQAVLGKMGVKDPDIDLDHPANPDFGDYSTSIALKLTKILKKNPFEIAQEIAKNLPKDTNIKKVEVLKPGFINFWISQDYLLKQIIELLQKKDNFGKSDLYKGKKIMVEYTDPNPFKEFHIGHLYSNTVGESLARLYDALGAEVKRANYQGDVGMHVAKSVWGMINKIKKEKLEIKNLEKLSLSEKAKFMGEVYALGAGSFEKNKIVKKEITGLNKKIYELDPTIKELYELGRQWTLDYFETIYKRLGTKFDYYYFEREAGEVGINYVKENLKKGLFEESQGAIIFNGEKYGLHTRVFVNSLGLPTYEAKDLGLATTKYKDYPYDLSIIVTGNEIRDYFKVVLKALEIINPSLRKKTVHISHGMVRLPEGKMSSRTGKVITVEWIFEEIKNKLKEIMKNNKKINNEELDNILEIISVAVIKYSLLKNGIGQDIIFDFKESLTLEGNSGPYLLYTFTRCQSVLKKSLMTTIVRSYNSRNINNDEKNLLRTLYQFPEIVEQSTIQFAPNLIANYLYELAQKYNYFYQKNKILESEEKTKQFRLMLTQAVGKVIKEGLYLLGIKTVEKM